MATAFVLPAFATETSDNSQNETETTETALSAWKSNFTDTDIRYSKTTNEDLKNYLTDAYCKKYENEINLNDYNIFAYYTGTTRQNTTNGWTDSDGYFFLCLPKSIEYLNYDYLTSSDVNYISIPSEYDETALVIQFGIVYNEKTSGFSCNIANSYNRTGNIVSFKKENTNYYVVISDINIDGILTADGEPPIPFTVSYSSELSMDMESNVVYIPSKGGANGDENGNLKQEIDGFSVTVTLTDDFKRVMNENDLGTDFSKSSYAVIGCLSTEPITKGTNMQSFFENKVVLYAYHSGMYETSYNDNVMPDTILQNANRSNTIATGLTPIFNIPRDNPLILGFSVSSIDFDGLGVSRDTPLYVNVIGIHARNYTNQNSNVSYTATSVDDFLSLRDPFLVKTIEAKKETNEPTNGDLIYGDNSITDDSNSSANTFDTLWNPALSSGIKNNNEKDVKYYYSYCISSENFKYSEYPEYKPITLTDSNGNKYNPSTSSLKDLLNIAPEKMTNTTLLNTAEKDSDVSNSFMDTDDFKQYKHDLTVSNNMLTMDVTSIGTLLDGTSQYFRFLTAGLMIFPSWFLTAITAFFSILLTIVLVGTVVKLITGVVGSIGNFLGGGSS